MAFKTHEERVSLMVWSLGRLEGLSTENSIFSVSFQKEAAETKSLVEHLADDPNFFEDKALYEECKKSTDFFKVLKTLKAHDFLDIYQKEISK